MRNLLHLLHYASIVVFAKYTAKDLLSSVKALALEKTMHLI